jgi:hypothetical protein
VQQVPEIFSGYLFSGIFNVRAATLRQRRFSRLLVSLQRMAGQQQPGKSALPFPMKPARADEEV